MSKEKNMNCPSCNRAIHFHPVREMSEHVEHVFQTEDENRFVDGRPGIGTMEGFCPACHQFIVILVEGYYHFPSDGIPKIEKETILYPRYRSPKTLPSEIPEAYRIDFSEAYSVLEISPKASAALSRRLLQNILHNAFGTKRKNLNQEIDEFIKRGDVPPYIADAVDAIRIVGNFAAHPLKYTNTNEIVNVEPEEAQWLIEVLDTLLDFAYVEPGRIEKKKLNLNRKLAALGKPPLKR